MFALGITSVFSQILDDMSKDESEAIFSAYIKALGEDAKTYQQDADKITKLAESCSGPDDLKPDGDGSEVRSPCVAWRRERACARTNSVSTPQLALSACALVAS